MWVCERAAAPCRCVCLRPHRPQVPPQRLHRRVSACAWRVGGCLVACVVALPAEPAATPGAVPAACCPPRCVCVCVCTCPGSAAPVGPSLGLSPCLGSGGSRGGWERGAHRGVPVRVRIPSLLGLSAPQEPPRAAPSLPPRACVPSCPRASWQRGLGLCPPASIAALSVCPPQLPAAHPLAGSLPPRHHAHREPPARPLQTQLLQPGCAGTAGAAVLAAGHRERGGLDGRRKGWRLAPGTEPTPQREAPMGQLSTRPRAGVERGCAWVRRSQSRRCWWEPGSRGDGRLSPASPRALRPPGLGRGRGDVGPAAVLSGAVPRVPGHRLAPSPAWWRRRQNQSPAPAGVPLCGEAGGLQRVARSHRHHSPGHSRSPVLPASQPAASIGTAQVRHPLGEGARGAPRCLTLGSRPLSSKRHCLSFPRLPAGGKAVNTAPVPGQPPHDESDRKTEPRSSVSDLVNSLTSEMLMVGGWGALGMSSPGMASHPGRCPGVSSCPSPGSSPRPPCATSTPAHRSQLCQVPVTAGRRSWHSSGSAEAMRPSPRGRREGVVPET